MKKKLQRIRKNIMVNPRVLRDMRKYLKASSDSQTIEIALQYAIDQDANNKK